VLSEYTSVAVPDPMALAGDTWMKETLLTVVQLQPLALAVTLTGFAPLAASTSIVVVDTAKLHPD
jgi:hypothetical protein